MRVAIVCCAVLLALVQSVAFAQDASDWRIRILNVTLESDPSPVELVDVERERYHEITSGDYRSQCEMVSACLAAFGDRFTNPALWAAYWAARVNSGVRGRFISGAAAVAQSAAENDQPNPWPGFRVRGDQLVWVETYTEQEQVGGDVTVMAQYAVVIVESTDVTRSQWAFNALPGVCAPLALTYVADDGSRMVGLGVYQTQGEGGSAIDQCVSPPTGSDYGGLAVVPYTRLVSLRMGGSRDLRSRSLVVAQTGSFERMKELLGEQLRIAFSSIEGVVDPVGAFVVEEGFTPAALSIVERGAPSLVGLLPAATSEQLKTRDGLGIPSSPLAPAHCGGQVGLEYIGIAVLVLGFIAWLMRRVDMAVIGMAIPAWLLVDVCMLPFEPLMAASMALVVVVTVRYVRGAV